MLTDRYLNGVPAGSRAARGGSLSTDLLTEDALGHIRALNEIAKRPRPVAGAAGAVLGAARRAGDVGAGRRVVGASAGGQPRRRAEPGVRRRRTGRRSSGTRSTPGSTCGARPARSDRPAASDGSDRPRGPRRLAPVGSVSVAGALGPPSSRPVSARCPRRRCGSVVSGCAPRRLRLVVGLGGLVGLVEQLVSTSSRPGEQLGELLVPVDEPLPGRRDPAATAADRGAPRARPGPRCRGTAPTASQRSAAARSRRGRSSRPISVAKVCSAGPPVARRRRSVSRSADAPGSRSPTAVGDHRVDPALDQREQRLELRHRVPAGPG